MFFSVKSSVKIAGKVYTPCICYALPEVLVPTIEKMAKEGRAYIYEHKVAFQNGKVIVKKAEAEVKAEKKPSRKAKKEAKLEPEEFAEEAEKIVTPDESEGF